MRRISAEAAEHWINLPELRRFQLGPMLGANDGRWISLAHRAHDTVFLEHDGALGMVHPAPLDGLYYVHHAIPRRLWGARAHAAARAMMIDAWDRLTPRPRRFLGLTMESNRLALRFARSLGFTIDGRIPFDDGFVVLTGATRAEIAASEHKGR